MLTFDLAGPQESAADDVLAREELLRDRDTSRLT